jgi:hypothetical protein
MSATLTEEGGGDEGGNEGGDEGGASDKAAVNSAARSCVQLAAIPATPTASLPARTIGRETAEAHEGSAMLSDNEWTAELARVNFTAPYGSPTRAELDALNQFRLPMLSPEPRHARTQVRRHPREPEWLPEAIRRSPTGKSAAARRSVAAAQLEAKSLAYLARICTSEPLSPQVAIARSAYGMASQKPLVLRTALYPARHGIPHGMVSRTAWYPARHGRSCV